MRAALLFMLFSLHSLSLAEESVKCGVTMTPRAMTVRFHYPASPVSQPTLELGEWAGVKNFPDDIYFLKATDDRGKELVVTKPSYERWQIATGGKPFNLEYSVICQKKSHEGTSDFNHFHPTLLPDWAFVWGYAWAIWPDDAELAKLPVEATLDPGPYKQGELSCKTTTFDGLSESLLVAGDYRHKVLTEQGRELSVWMTGDWKFKDDEFLAALQGIQRTQTKMLGPLPPGRLMIALIPGSQNSTGGTAVESAIGIYPRPSESLTDNNAKTLKLIAHEHFHLWNGKAIRPEKGHKEGYYKWFQEGLTDYYSLKTLLVNGALTPEQFLQEINASYQRYQTNPYALTATAEVMAEHYWDNQNYQRLPYDKGVASGLLLDLQLDGGLDPFMRAIKALGKPFDEAAVESALKESPAGFSKQYLFGAQALPYQGFEKLDVAKATVKVFELGIRMENKQIKEVIPGSNAEKAGLKANEPVAGYSFYGGDPTREAIIQVVRDGKTVDVKYMPVREAEVLQIQATPKSLASIRQIARG